MKIVLLIAFALAMLVVLGVVFLNRESPEVVTAAVPVAFGAVSALWLVFAFARAEPIRHVFPATFFLQRADKLPTALPDRPFPPEILATADQALQNNPKALDEPAGSSFGTVVYHEFLQHALVDRIAMRRFGTWRVEVERFQTGTGQQEQFGPTADASRYRSVVLSREEIERKLAPNRFARFHTGFGKLALPPGTTFTVRTPEGNPPRGEIRFQNWFCDIRVETVPSFGGVGLGAYAGLLGMSLDQAQELYWHQQFIVRATATFPRYLMGHPQMPAYREWAEGIFRDIADAFNEEQLWRRTTENYTLRQQMPPPARDLRIPIGPVRSTPLPKKN